MWISSLRPVGKRGAARAAECGNQVPNQATALGESFNQAKQASMVGFVPVRRDVGGNSPDIFDVKLFLAS